MALASSRIKTDPHHVSRERLLLFGFILGIFVVLSRLFYWQVIEGDRLKAQANDQYERKFTSTGKRGTILTSDGHTLVSNERVYRLFAQPYILNQEPAVLSSLLAPLVVQDVLEYQTASPSAQSEITAETIQEQIKKKLENKNSKWVSLIGTVSQETRDKIAEMKLKGVGFDQYEKRYYPEASMAAHLTGFVGKDDDGNDIGYFGIEGALEQELKARSQKTTIMADAFGLPLPSEDEPKPIMLDGRDITLTIRRDIQNLAEQKLEFGMERYGAEAGEIIIMNPKTGAILAMAATPKYDQRHFYRYPARTYPNPSLSSVYEPGSTFKILTVASGIDAGLITPDTQCDTCAGPRVFGKYTIKTWNDEYHPNITMTDGLAKSDNTAMIFVAEKLGPDKFKEYLQKFGVGEALHIELQGDRKTPFPSKWGPVELATISFGQGIGTTSLQLMRAISTIANGGVMIRPRIIESVTDWGSGQTITPEPVEERRVISKETADTVTKMMIESAGHGEAQWTASRTHWIAGKTGTSQIAAESGGYEESKTMASFIGFAPPDDPQFVMVVKLLAPTSSQWASETAAPLWYNTAKDLFLLLNLPPDRSPADVLKPATAKAPVGD
jgi:stage V sporulation protein D (sporulation-specific penicillin-binding protein)